LKKSVDKAAGRGYDGTISQSGTGKKDTMTTILDIHATPAERAEADRLAKEDVIGNGNAIHDLDVSCYEARGEGGKWEEVHEQRLSDRSCRCGYYQPRP
jgi:hypothetical protein